MDGGDQNSLKCREKNVSSCRLTEQNTRSCEEVPAVPEILTRQKLEVLQVLKKQKPDLYNIILSHKIYYHI